MQSEFSKKNTTGIAALSGGLNAVNVDQFRQEFKTWYENNPELKNVILDFSDVDMVDSAGLGVLIGLLKLVSERDGDLKLVGLSKRVRLVFQITRTQRIFTILDTMDEALDETE